jgi:hypothetical protein
MADFGGHPKIPRISGADAPAFLARMRDFRKTEGFPAQISSASDSSDIEKRIILLTPTK